MLRYALVTREGRIISSVLLVVLVFWVVLETEAWPVVISLSVLGGTAWLLRRRFCSHFHAASVPFIPFSILSPINGKITAVGKSKLPGLEKEVVHLQIAMDWFTETIIFSPVTGKPIKEENLRRLCDARDSRPQIAACLETDEGDEIRMLFTALGRLNNFNCRVHLGERIGQGQCCGSSRFACRVDIYLPQYARLHVKAGEQVRAGHTCLADLRRRETAPAASLS